MTPLEHIATLPGWCIPEKSRELARLVREYRPAVICEVGVFGGRSLLPMALACHEVDHGIVYGVDPWDIDAALEGTVQSPDANWWRECDLQLVKLHFLGAMLHHGLHHRVKVLEARWVDVHPAVPEIDLAHCDGNHSPEVSFVDTQLLLSKLRPGGWFVIDDTDSPVQIARALDLLNSSCRLVRDWGTWRVYRKHW